MALFICVTIILGNDFFHHSIIYLPISLRTITKLTAINYFVFRLNILGFSLGLFFLSWHLSIKCKRHLCDLMQNLYNLTVVLQGIFYLRTNDIWIMFKSLQSNIFQRVHILWCRYKAGYYHENSHNRRPVARPSGRDMGCLFWKQVLIYLMPQSLKCCMERHMVVFQLLSSASLRWRHNGRDSVSNHQPHDCLLNRLFRRRSKKTSKPCVTGLCAGNSPGTGEFPAQMASNAENVSIWWRIM